VTTILIGLGEYALSSTAGDCIKTLGLGSCVAVTALHGGSGTVAMAHIVLPDSNSDPTRAKKQPGYFADTAIVAMFEELTKATGGKGRFLIKLIGGASVLRQAPANALMHIGKRNILAAKKALWKRGLGALGEDTGGTVSRSISITVGSDLVNITTNGKIKSTL